MADILSGVVDLGLGLGQMYLNEKNRREAERQKQKAKEQVGQLSNQYELESLQRLQNTNANIGNILGGLESQSTSIVDAMGNVKPEFNASAYNVEDYVAGNKENIIANAVNAVKGSGASAGSSFGTGALNEQVASAVDTSEDLYRDAQNQMNTAKAFDYNVAQNEASMTLEALRQRLANVGNIASLKMQNEQNILANEQDLYNSVFATKAGSILS